MASLEKYTILYGRLSQEDMQKTNKNDDSNSIQNQRMLFGRTTANRVSRFVSEIPEEHIEKNIPRAYGYQDRSREPVGAFASPKREVRKTAFPVAAPSAPKAAPSVDYTVGDRVKHKAFGPGEIVKMTPMGGDFLVEIRFGGTVKKLMLRAAAQHMEKQG